MSTPARARAIEAAAVALLLAGFLALAAHRIERPGLHSDELLFALPALKAGGATYDPWFHLPLMLGDYLGAPKSYLFMPLFALWSPSPLVIRLPGVLLATAVLLGFWLFARRAGGAAAGLASLALLAVDPSYAFAARVDWGPTVLMQALKAVALLALWRALERERPAWLWVVTLACLLGLYDKLNFVWVVNALALAALGAHGRRLLRLARSSPRRFWPPVLLLAAATATLVVTTIVGLMGQAHPDQARLTLVQRVGHTLSLVARTFDGSLIHDWIVLRPMPRWPVALALHAWIVVALAALWLGRRRPWSEGQSGVARWLAFCLLVEGTLVAQLVTTRAVWGAHHVLVLWPFPQAAAALSLVLALERSAGAPTARRALAAAAALCAALVWTGQARAAVRYERSIYAPPSTPNPLFTPEIYELSAWVNARLPGVASVITADWGLRYPLRTLAPGGQREKIRDFWLIFRDYGRGEGRYLYKEWFEGRSVIVVSYLPTRTVFQASDSNWRGFAQKHLEPRATMRRTTLGSYEIVCVSPDESAAALCAQPTPAGSGEVEARPR